MKRRPDFEIRAARQAMLDRVKFLESKYSVLNNAEWVLSQNPVRIRQVIDNYKKDLSKIVHSFFTGDKVIGVSIQAHKEFVSALSRYSDSLNIQPSISESNVEKIITNISQNVDGLVTGIETGLMAKALAMRQSIDEEIRILAQKAISVVDDIGGRIENISARTTGFDPSNITKEQKGIIARKWSELTDQYGATDTVKYTNGANYPLRTYLDGRANTTAADIHRATTALDASTSGVYTGIVSRHGNTCDTCLKWEGKIVFFSQTAKNLFVQSYPQAASWPTLQELEDNSDHIFKFNCLHIVSAYPIQFFDRSDIEQVLRSAA